MTPSDGQKWTQIAPAAIINEKKKDKLYFVLFFLNLT